MDPGKGLGSRADPTRLLGPNRRAQFESNQATTDVHRSSGCVLPAAVLIKLREACLGLNRMLASA